MVAEIWTEILVPGTPARGKACQRLGCSVITTLFLRNVMRGGDSNMYQVLWPRSPTWSDSRLRETSIWIPRFENIKRRVGSSTITRRYASLFLITDRQDLRKIIRSLQIEGKTSWREMLVNIRIEAFWDVTSCQLLKFPAFRRSVVFPCSGTRRHSSWTGKAWRGKQHALPKSCVLFAVITALHPGRTQS
jgi:hypothetical protein